MATRVVVGAGLAAVAFACVVNGIWAFAILVAMLAALAIVEWGRISKVLFNAGLLWGGSLTLVIAVAAGGKSLLALEVLLIYSVALAVSGDRLGGRQCRSIGWGLLYVGLPALCLIWLYLLPVGRTWVEYTICVVVIADIAAYAVGRLIGGPKLWPRISPGKTWAGFAGACLAAMAASVAVAPYANIAPVRAAIAGLLLGALAQGGDLFESWLKRRAGVKDSGTLLPGHGGVLDRLDSLIPVAPVVAGAVWLGWL